MAKLKGPLFSLGATQKLADTIVYFPWKGLNVAREYVVPTNPRTGPQLTQRGYITSAVTLIHACQALPVNPLDADDVTAMALLASTRSTPRTWFNELVRQCVDQMVASLTYGAWCNGSKVEAADEVDISAYGVHVVDVTAATIWYGTSKTALINFKAGGMVANHFTVDVTGLTTGVKYYFQIRPTAPAACIGCNSGIYTGTPL